MKAIIGLEKLFKKNYFCGILTAIHWDENGIPVKFSLYEPNGTEYILKTSNNKIKLREFNNKEVIVYGTIFDSADELNQILYLSSISLIKNPMPAPKFNISEDDLNEESGFVLSDEIASFDYAV